jgi:hypothetical protein
LFSRQRPLPDTAVVVDGPDRHGEQVPEHTGMPDCRLTHDQGAAVRVRLSCDGHDNS